MPKCFVQCVVCMCKYICIWTHIHIFILEIDIPSETTFRSNWCIGISFIFLICEVYGTNYLFPDVCQIWIKALVRNSRMYTKCFWLEKWTTILWHTTIYSAQTSTISIFPVLYIPIPHFYFLSFWGYNTVLF